MVVFALLYTRVDLPVLGKPMRQVVGFNTIEALTTIAAIAVALYAYKTVNQMVRDRSKDRVEKALELVYSPLYKILRDARDKGRKEHSQTTWDVSKLDLDRIDKILEDYGHYFDEGDLEAFRAALAIKTEEPIHHNSWLFDDKDVKGPFEDVIEKKWKRLHKEFRDLTKPP